MSSAALSLGVSALKSALNPEQFRAATHVDGPLLVLAGAGSGKTRVLIHRIAHILDQEKAKPWQIMAVTFTNKAAAEMRHRLETLVGPTAKEAWLGTFHALSARMLRIEGYRLGYAGNFSIYDAEDSKRLLKQILKEMGIETNHHGVNPNSIGGEIDRAKNKGLGPKAFAESVQAFDVPARKLAKAVYFKYQDALRKANAMDFGDLVYLSTELLKHHPAAAARFQKRFRYIMVDEFQDTNHIQYEWLKVLLKDHENLMVVGDDDQSIYRWRGAEVAHILGFEHTFPKSEVVRLEQNYRSTGNILDAANAVIARNQRRHGKNLFTESGPGAKVGLALLESSEQEAELVINLIREEIEEGADPADCAILYRMNAQSRMFESHLRRARIPYRLVGGTGFFDRMEVKDIVAYLRLIVNPNSRSDFERVVNTPGRGIGAKTIERLRAAGEAAGLEGLRMLELDDAALKKAGLSAASIKKLRGFEALILELKQLSLKQSATQVATEVVHRTDYEKHLLAKDRASAEDRFSNVEELVSSVAELEARIESESQSKTSLERFLDEASLASGERSEGDIDGVRLMTLHTAKGLEFPCVLMVGLEEKTFPSARAVEDGEEAPMEEERRLCYVGMTRAMRKLTLTSARRRVIFGKTEVRLPSRFLGEIPDDVVETAGFTAPSALVSFKSLADRGLDGPLDRPLDDRDDGNPFFEEPSSEEVRTIASVEIGAESQVFHRSFGRGKVLQVEGAGPRARATVSFESGATKTIVLKFLEHSS